jgi:hypothetical protein
MCRAEGKCGGWRTKTAAPRPYVPRPRRGVDWFRFTFSILLPTPVPPGRGEPFCRPEDSQGGGGPGPPVPPAAAGGPRSHSGPGCTRSPRPHTPARSWAISIVSSSMPAAGAAAQPGRRSSDATTGPPAALRNAPTLLRFYPSTPASRALTSPSRRTIIAPKRSRRGECRRPRPHAGPRGTSRRPRVTRPPAALFLFFVVGVGGEVVLLRHSTADPCTPEQSYK